MISDTPYTLLCYYSKLIKTISANNQHISHWIALRHMNITELNSRDWVWKNSQNMDARFEEDNTVVIFHPDFSSGTEIIVGNIQFVKGNVYFWEIELLSPVYGTDMMVGFLTEDFNSKPYQFLFRSALGENEHSWGVSYHGYSQHCGIKSKIIRNFYPSKFSEGTKIAFQIDTWNGHVSLYINGHPHGIVWRSQKFVNKTIHPAISSTAARTKMKLLTTYSSRITLNYLASRALAQQYSMSELIELNQNKNLSYNTITGYFTKSITILTSQE
ncbi:hypothetical protein HZS_4169 [Henneguya salminicola]|nr:hypothetical protein HZS_4169 [Henneguya salminicola]